MLRTSLLFLSIPRPKRWRSLGALPLSQSLIVLLTYGGCPHLMISLWRTTLDFFFLHWATQVFIHFPFPGNVLCLEQKDPEHSHVPFPSPNNIFTVWSPKCFFFYLMIPELLQQLLGTVAMWKEIIEIGVWVGQLPLFFSCSFSKPWTLSFGRPTQGSPLLVIGCGVFSVLGTVQLALWEPSTFEIKDQILWQDLRT